MQEPSLQSHIHMIALVQVTWEASSWKAQIYYNFEMADYYNNEVMKP